MRAILTRSMGKLYFKAQPSHSIYTAHEKLRLTRDSSCNNGQLTTLGGSPVSGGSSGTVYSPSNNGLGGASPSPYAAIPSPTVNGLPPYPQASATDSSSSNSSGAPADASADDPSQGSDDESGDGGNGSDSKR